MYTLSSILSIPRRVLESITSGLNLVHYHRPIILVTPRNPANVRLNGSGKKEVSLNRFVRERCASLLGTFKPSWWLPNGHLQTMYSVVGNFTKVDTITYERQLLQLPDGGTIAIDTTPPNHLSLPADAPTVIVAHGLTGGSHESYVRNVLEWVVRPKSEGGLGGRGVVSTYRGCAGSPLTSPQFYSAGHTGDLHQIIAHTHSLFPSSPLIALGFSLGASVTARYMGEEGDDSMLEGAVVVGCPWDIPKMSRTLEEGWFSSRVYSQAMGSNLVRIISTSLLRHPDLFTPSNPNTPYLPDLTSIPADLIRLKKKGRSLRLRDVDEVLTSKVGGLRTDNELGMGKNGKAVFPMKDAEEYYAWARSDKWIERVKRPMLAINAFDDPIIDGASLPVEAVQNSSHVVLAITGGGGHLGWFNGAFFPSLFSRRPSTTNHSSTGTHQQRWIINPISEFITALLDEVERRDPKDDKRSRELVEKEGGWKEVKGSEGDRYGLVGWKEVGGLERVEGADDEIAEPMQGL